MTAFHLRLQPVDATHWSEKPVSNQNPAGSGSRIADSGKHLEGIGGWLTLLAIQIALAVIMYLGQSGLRTGVVNGPMWDQLDADLRSWLLLEMWVLLLFSVAWLIAIVLMFRKSKSFPSWFMGTMIGAWLFNALSGMGLVSAAPEELSGQTAGIVAFAAVAIAWIIYIQKSERVKNTFTK